MMKWSKGSSSSGGASNTGYGRCSGRGIGRGRVRETPAKGGSRGTTETGQVIPPPSLYNLEEEFDIEVKEEAEKEVTTRARGICFPLIFLRWFSMY